MGAVDTLIKVVALTEKETIQPTGTNFKMGDFKVVTVIVLVMLVSQVVNTATTPTPTTLIPTTPTPVDGADMELIHNITFTANRTHSRISLVCSVPGALEYNKTVLKALEGVFSTTVFTRVHVKSLSMYRIVDEKFKDDNNLSPLDLHATLAGTQSEHDDGCKRDHVSLHSPTIERNQLGAQVFGERTLEKDGIAFVWDDPTTYTRLLVDGTYRCSVEFAKCRCGSLFGLAGTSSPESCASEQSFRLTKDLEMTFGSPTVG